MGSSITLIDIIKAFFTNLFSLTAVIVIAIFSGLYFIVDKTWYAVILSTNLPWEDLTPAEPVAFYVFTAFLVAVMVPSFFLRLTNSISYAKYIHLDGVHQVIGYTTPDEKNASDSFVYGWFFGLIVFLYFVFSLILTVFVAKKTGNYDIGFVPIAFHTKYHNLNIACNIIGVLFLLSVPLIILRLFFKTYESRKKFDKITVGMIVGYLIVTAVKWVPIVVTWLTQ